MADWDSNFTELPSNPSPTHSAQSSEISGIVTNGNKENHNILHRMDSEVSTEDSERELILNGGRELKGESKTEAAYDNLSMSNSNTPEVPRRGTRPFNINGNSNEGSAKERAAKSVHAPSTIDSIPEEKVDIPKDGNISGFNADQMTNFFRCLKIDDKIISYLQRKNVDGKRFARFKDSEFEAVGLHNNGVLQFFKERSSSKSKKGNAWRL